MTNSTSISISKTVIKGIQEKKGKDIVKIDLRGQVNRVCDYFIICHADSGTHVKSVYESVEESVKDTCGEKPWKREGLENQQWILLDYSDVVVHIFQKPTRDFYQLEALWGDAKVEQIEEESRQA
jgi:ribosome-associated protein